MNTLQLLIKAIKILGYSKQVLGTLGIIEDGYLLCPRDATLEDLDEELIRKQMEANLSDVAIEDIESKAREFAFELSL